MRILLDTHAVLWAIGEPGRLGRYRDLVMEPTTTRLLSAVVTWEMAIKTRLGRLPLTMPFEAWIRRAIVTLMAQPVPVHWEQTLAVATLPLHHRDPFDRLLVAQAQHLGVPLLTADEQLARYDIEVLLVT